MTSSPWEKTGCPPFVVETKACLCLETSYLLPFVVVVVEFYCRLLVVYGWVSLMESCCLLGPGVLLQWTVDAIGWLWLPLQSRLPASLVSEWVFSSLVQMNQCLRWKT